MSEGRECRTCGAWKSAENFSKTATGALFSYCKPCHNARTLERYHKNKALKGRHGKTRAGENIKADTTDGRTCLDCSTWKSKENFRVVKNSGNLFSYCHDCWSVRQNAKYTTRKQDPEYMARLADSNAQSRRRIKEAVLAGYGGKCACCGESQEEFLTLDHVNNDGSKHRAETGLRTGQTTWAWARKNNFPDVLQLLCWNCNSAKGAYGYCPHTRQAV